LVDPVREALLLIQTTLGSQPTFTAATTQREFTLIMSEEAVPDLLPAITERVSTDAPGIRINIELVSHRALSQLEYGDADLCLCMDSLGMFDVRAYPDTLRSIRLRPVRWICAVDRNHPTVGDSISSEQYFSLPHVFGRPNGSNVTAKQLVRRLLGIDLEVHITVPSLLHLPFVLPGTRLVATLPERVAHRFASTLPVKTFALPFETQPLHEILGTSATNRIPRMPGCADLIARLTLPTRDVATQGVMPRLAKSSAIEGETAAAALMSA
jgi:DNA-binding transcriptional LysR family regulator